MVPPKNSEYGLYSPKNEGSPPEDVFDTFPNYYYPTVTETGRPGKGLHKLSVCLNVFVPDWIPDTQFGEM